MSGWTRDPLTPADLSHLPWPDEWPSRRRGLLGALFLCGLLTMAGPALAVAGDVEAAGRALLATPVTGAFTVLAADQLHVRRRSLRHVRVRPHDGVNAGTVVPQRRLQHLCFLVPVLVGLAIGVAALGDSAARGDLGRAATGLLWFVLFGWATVDVVRRLGHRAQLLLTPHEIAVDEKGRRTAVPWRDVIGLGLGANREATLAVFVLRPEGSAGWRFRWWAPSRLPPGVPIKLFPERYAIDPVALLATLEFYLAHPTLRPELADGQMLERLRRGDITRDASATVSSR